MNTRKRLRPFANWLADAMEERWAPALRKAVERKPRPRPLRFPSAYELQMERITGAAMQQLANSMVRNIIRDPLMFRVDPPKDEQPIMRIRYDQTRVNHDQP